jgi:hypothetical protein
MEKGGFKVLNKQVMMLKIPLQGLTVCKICGSKKIIDIDDYIKSKTKEQKMPAGSWQCLHGCKFLEGGKVWNGKSQKIEDS